VESQASKLGWWSQGRAVKGNPSGARSEKTRGRWAAAIDTEYTATQGRRIGWLGNGGLAIKVANGTLDYHQVEQPLPNVVLGPNSRVGPTGAGGAKGWKASSRKQEAAAVPVRGNMFGLLADGSSPQLERGRKGEKPTADSKQPDRASKKPNEKDKRYPASDRTEREAEKPSGKEEGNTSEKEGGSEEAEKEIDLLIQEYLDTGDKEEALTCMRDLGSEEYYPKVVTHAVQLALDKKEDERESLCHLLRHFFKHSLMSSTLFEKGFDEVLDALPDLRLDAPLAPKYVGHFLGSGLLDEYLSPSYLVSALTRLAPSGLGELVAASVFNYIVDNEDFDYLRQLYEENGFQVMDFFKPANRNDAFLDTWLAKNGLQRLFPAPPSDDYEQVLREKLKTEPTVDELLKWIETTISRKVWTEAGFAQKLLYLVLEVTTAKVPVDNLAMEAEQLEAFAQVFKKFFPEDIGQQTECLAEAQRFCYEKGFPKGLLGLVFRYLYDQDLVDEEAFRAWEGQAGPGKAQALEEVASQLQWLRTAKQEDEEDDNRQG